MSMHTFGGHALDRLLYEFETTGDASEGAGALGGAGGDAGAAPSPAPAGESESSADATAAAPAWSPEQIAALRDNPDFRSFVAEEAASYSDARLAPVLGLLQQLAGSEGTGAAAAALGPLDPWADDFGASLDQRFQSLEQRLSQMLDRVAQPLAAREEAETVARGNQNVDGWITDDIARNGEIGEKARGLVGPLAESLFPTFAARFGQGPRAAELAVQEALRTVRGIVGEAKGAGVGEHTQNLVAINSARGDLAGSGSGSGVTTLSEPTSSRERIARFAPAIQAARG